MDARLAAEQANQPLTDEARTEAATKIQHTLDMLTLPLSLPVPNPRKGTIEFLTKPITLEDLEESVDHAQREKLSRFKTKLQNGEWSGTIQEALAKDEISVPMLKQKEHLWRHMPFADTSDKIDFYIKSKFIFDYPLHIDGARVENILTNHNLNDIGSIVLRPISDWNAAITTRFGPESKNNLQRTLSHIGLKLGMTAEELSKFENNPPEEFLAAYPKIREKYFPHRPPGSQRPSFINMEVHHSFKDFRACIDNVETSITLPSGSTYAFTDARQADYFASIAKSIVAGNQLDAGETPLLSPVTRYTSLETDGTKGYLVHLSDDTLKVLSQEEPLKQLTNKLIANQRGAGVRTPG